MSTNTRDQQRLDFLSHVSMGNSVIIEHDLHADEYIIIWNAGTVNAYQVTGMHGLRATLDKAIMHFYGRETIAEEREDEQ